MNTECDSIHPGTVVGMAESSMIMFEPLPENAVVYRALLRKQRIDEDTGMVKADACRQE